MCDRLAKSWSVTERGWCRKCGGMDTNVECFGCGKDEALG